MTHFNWKKFLSFASVLSTAALLLQFNQLHQLDALSSDLTPYEVSGVDSKFFNLVVEKYDLGSSQPHVIAQMGSQIFVAARESMTVKMMAYRGSALTLMQAVELPKLADEQNGGGKYILDLETRSNSDLFVSYLEWYDDTSKCDRVVVIRFRIRDNRINAGNPKKVFTSTPCWTMLRQDSLRGGYTASGRLAVHGNRLFVEGGMVMIELGHNKYPNPGIGGLSGNFRNDVQKTNLFGSVTEVDLKTLKWTKLSTGHRNPQGLLYDAHRNLLWSSEHGPSGGCELNIIRKGKDYGWPYVSFGREYFDPDILPENNLFKTRYGTHSGYELPAFAWNPSIGPSQLVVVPPGHSFGPVWTSDLLLSSLRDQSIYRIVADKAGRVLVTERIPIGFRIRDLTIGLSDVWASTDDGKLLRLSRYFDPAP